MTPRCSPASPVSSNTRFPLTLSTPVRGRTVPPNMGKHCHYTRQVPPPHHNEQPLGAPTAQARRPSAGTEVGARVTIGFQIRACVLRCAHCLVRYYGLDPRLGVRLLLDVRDTDVILSGFYLITFCSLDGGWYFASDPRRARFNTGCKPRRRREPNAPKPTPASPSQKPAAQNLRHRHCFSSTRTPTASPACTRRSLVFLSSSRPRCTTTTASHGATRHFRGSISITARTASYTHV